MEYQVTIKIICLSEIQIKPGSLCIFFLAPLLADASRNHSSRWPHLARIITLTSATLTVDGSQLPPFCTTAQNYPGSITPGPHAGTEDCKGLDL